MKQSLTQLTLAAVVSGTLACSFVARDANSYRDDTRALLETKNAEIQQCYDQALQADAGLGGTVAVRFTVQSETGRIVDAVIDPARTTAPEALSSCVVGALGSLALAPPDENDGHATFVYEFAAGPALPSAPPPG